MHTFTQKLRPAHSLAFTVATLLAPLCIASPSNARAAGPAEPVTVVAFGDSTTAPRGSLAIYSRILQEELSNVSVINAGVPGNTTEMARTRFERAVLAHHPQIAIVQFGINDSAIDVWKTPPATEPRVPLG